MKPKGVTIQMKALDEYILMVVFMLLLNRVHVFANVMFNLEKHGSEKVNCDVAQKRWTHHLRSPLPKARRILILILLCLTAWL